MRGFIIYNPLEKTPPENYFVFQHKMSVDRGTESFYFNPAIYNEDFDKISEARHTAYKYCSINSDTSWLRVLSLGIGYKAKTTYTLHCLKINKDGAVVPNSAPKENNEEYDHISWIVHIFEKSFDENPCANSKSPTSPEKERFWQRRFFWPTFGLACLVGGLFAYRSYYLKSLFSHLRSHR